MNFMQRNVMLWIFAAALILFVLQSTVHASPVHTFGTPRYHRLDNTTTLVVPDKRFPIVCTYVESMKTPERDVRVEGELVRLPAVFTSGMGCVLMPDVTFDEFLERYP